MCDTFCTPYMYIQIASTFKEQLCVFSLRLGESWGNPRVCAESENESKTVTGYSTKAKTAGSRDTGQRQETHIKMGAVYSYLYPEVSSSFCLFVCSYSY